MVPFFNIQRLVNGNWNGRPLATDPNTQNKLALTVAEVQRFAWTDCVASQREAFRNTAHTDAGLNSDSET